MNQGRNVKPSYLQHNIDNMSILDQIIAVIAPHNCLGCGQEGPLLCTKCAQDMPALPDRCYRCAVLTRDSAVCERCRRQSPLRHVWVAAQYEATAKDLVYQLKFGRAAAACEPLVEAMSSRLPFLPEQTFIVPVPTATMRVRQRGYDQAVLLAQLLARQQQRPYKELLARMGHTRQVGANKATRQQQLAQAFRVLRADQTKGANILLVDDLVTTGATLESAARLLKAAGAKSVNAVVFAQKQ